MAPTNLARTLTICAYGWLNGAGAQNRFDDCPLRRSEHRLRGLRSERRAPALVYLHGQPGSRLDLGRDDLVAPLAEAGYRLIGLDQPGFGGTRFVPGLTYTDWAEDVDEVANRLDLDRF